MDDLDEIRSRVEERAQAAVADSLGSGSADVADETLTTMQIAERGWDMANYNAFFSSCRKAGFGASDCGSMWTKAKEDGMAGSPSSVKPVEQESDADKTHVLMMSEESESSQLAAKYLSSPIMDGDIQLVTVASDTGQAMLDSLETVPEVPAHLIADDDGVAVGELGALFERHSV